MVRAHFHSNESADTGIKNIVCFGTFSDALNKQKIH